MKLNKILMKVDWKQSAFFYRPFWDVREMDDLVEKGMSFMKYIGDKVSDKIEQFYNSGKVVATNFFEPPEVVQVMGELRYVEHITWGGFEEAERKIIFIGVEHLEELENQINDFITVLRVEDMNGTLTHRAVLGSVLGLGIKREMLGDIVVQNNLCDIIISKTVAEYVLNNLKSVGRDKVSVKEISFEELMIPEDSSKEIKTTVSSLRVDSVISAGYGISREKSSALVKGELVKLNHIVIKSPVKSVREGDVISVRGKGRLEIREIGGTSKSGRIKIVLARK